jgi:hypothetical protein
LRWVLWFFLAGQKVVSPMVLGLLQRPSFHRGLRPSLTSWRGPVKVFGKIAGQKRLKYANMADEITRNHSGHI